MEVILWPEDKECDREWMLENVKGVDGMLVMLSDNVCLTAR
jgi:hypothetical protein